MKQEPQNDQSTHALADALNVSFRILRFVMIGLLLVYLIGSTIFTIKPGQTALVLRFGRLQGVARKSGLSWSLPYPIDQVIRIPSGEARSIESSTFWYYETAEERLLGSSSMPGNTLVPGRDGYLLTGDANILHALWIMRYRIDNAHSYAFEFSDLEQLLHNELDRAVVVAMARWDIDSALLSDETLKEYIQKTLTARCDVLGLGITVEGVDAIEITPPRQVKGAFEAVDAAKSESAAKLTDAGTYRQQVLSGARSEESRLEASSIAYKDRLKNTISADASYFEKIYEKFKKNPNITTGILLQDTLKRTLACVDKKYLIHRSRSGKLELRLFLNQQQDNLWKEQEQK